MKKYLTLITISLLILGCTGSVVKKNHPKIAKTFPKPTAADEVTYIGAVLEYEPYNTYDDVEKGTRIVRENANIIVQYAADAKLQSADILVAPEYGLQSLDTFENDTETFITFNQYVPDPSAGINPCLYTTSNGTKNFEAMQILSCGARLHQIYLVVDLGELQPCSAETIPLAPWEVQPSANCSASGFFIYNTQVVFDREGTVIARYRKQHLFNEDAYEQGALDDSTAIFVTDFDVMFSLQICFDIVFQHPGYNNVQTYGLKDVAMSTAWVDYLPFALANNIQYAWSRGYEVNLLVSGHHVPEKSKMGSGIYRGYKNESPVYTYDKDSGNVLLVAPVTTIRASSLTSVKSSPKRTLSNVPSTKPLIDINFEFKQIEEEDRRHVFVHENLINYTNVILLPGQPGVKQNVSACSFDNLCCNLEYEYTGNLTYMLLAFSGHFSVSSGRYPIGIQNCAVLWCRTKDVNTCSFIELGLPEDDYFGPFTLSTSNFIIDTIFPQGHHRNLSFIDNANLKYEYLGNYYSISTTTPVHNHLMAALYGRWYDNDGFGKYK